MKGRTKSIHSIWQKMKKQKCDFEGIYDLFAIRIIIDTPPDVDQMTEQELRDGYDAVFHMVTAAKGAERFYTTANNKVRTESPEQARALDDKLLAAWTGHPHLRVIGNTGSFEDKLKHLVAEIRSFLGEPRPMEIERKFLIEYPDIKWLESLPNCRKVDIIQTYLRPQGEYEVAESGRVSAHADGRGSKPPAHPQDPLLPDLGGALLRGRYLSPLERPGHHGAGAAGRERAYPPAAQAEADPGGHQRPRLPEFRPGFEGAGGLIVPIRKGGA